MVGFVFWPVHGTRPEVRTLGLCIRHISCAAQYHTIRRERADSSQKKGGTLCSPNDTKEDTAMVPYVIEYGAAFCSVSVVAGSVSVSRYETSEAVGD